MTLATLLKYLLGSRQAILQVAASRGAVYVGLLFVLAAGIAREYDGQDLLRQPWHLVLPLAASLVTSALLYLLLHGLVFLRAWEVRPVLSYRAFLGLYWMTAPLALLYGIPVERFLSAGDATRANLALLAIVSLWRVLLMSRAISVVYQVNFFRALFPVMLFADSVALVLVWLTPIPVLSVMGGIRLSESEDVIFFTTMAVSVLGMFSWPIWLVGAVITMSRSWRLVNLAEVPPRPIAWSVWLTAAAAIGLWAVFLPATQAEQQLRSQTESLLRDGQIGAALQLMSAHERGDFPPHWDPPPRIAYREESPDITHVQERLIVLPVKDWVREIYVEKFRNALRGESEGGVWYMLNPQEFERRIAILERLPERNDILKEHANALKYQAPKLASPLRQRVETLLEGAGVKLDGPKPLDVPRETSTPPSESPAEER